MEMPKPSPGHARLKTLAGTWKGEETMHPSPWDPAGGSARGTNRNALGLGGFALLTDYEQERDGSVTFAGHGVYTYDPSADRYTLHWFDSLGSPPEVFSGSFEGDVLTLSHGGPGMHVRMRSDVSTPGSMKASMEMSENGRQWKVLFEATYRRV